MKRREFLRAITGSLVLPLVPVADALTPLKVTITCDTSQFIESLEFCQAEMARIFQVPLHLLDHTPPSRSWLQAEEHRILYGTGEHRPMGLLDCRSPLKAALTLSHAQAGPGSLDRQVS